MNERIKELLQQAGPESADFPYDEFGIPSEQEKFAELLIEKVCYDIMNVHGASPEHIVLVAKHYGVEL